MTKASLQLSNDAERAKVKQQAEDLEDSNLSTTHRSLIAAQSGLNKVFGNDAIAATLAKNNDFFADLHKEAAEIRKLKSADEEAAEEK